VTRFYEHESCGKCTPCREGTYWMAEVFERLENGHGKDSDIDLLASVADNILGKSFCALGDAAAMPVQGALKHFRDEFEHHVAHKACRVNRRRDEVAEVRA
jgi:NADH-quinone oxidoreductase subunit F